MDSPEQKRKRDIRQRYSWDCGHACLAFVLNKSLEDVLAFMPHRELTDWDIGWALKIHRKNRKGHEIEMTKEGKRIVNVGEHWIAVDGDKVMCPAGRSWINKNQEGIAV